MTPRGLPLHGDGDGDGSGDGNGSWSDPAMPEVES